MNWRCHLARQVAFLLGSGGLLLLAFACGGPRATVVSAIDRGDIHGSLVAYERFRETDGADADLLGEIAALVLAREGSSSDPERARAAIAQLRYAGTSGRTTLVALSEQPGVSLSRALALNALAARDPQAASFLFGMLDEADPKIVALAIGQADPVRDRVRLFAFMQSSNAELRGAALRRFGGPGAPPEWRETFLQVARMDDSPSVRAAAVRALSGFGSRAMDDLIERLSDTNGQVRLAATRAILSIGALERVDQDEYVATESTARAEQQLQRWLGAAPSRATLEAARVVLSSRNGSYATYRDRAEAFLHSALVGSDRLLTSQAAVALVSAQGTDLLLVSQLLSLLSDSEVEPGVRLSLARVLVIDHPDDATVALRALLHGTGMVRLQAASVLAEQGEEAALQILESTLDSDADTLLRQVAARALGRQAGRFDRLRSTLEDRDPLVQIQAAGAILAAS